MAKFKGTVFESTRMFTQQHYGPDAVARVLAERGWLQGAIEASGGKNASVTELRCACRGHDRCIFDMSWDE